MINRKSPLRFLILPSNSNPYDKRMVKGFQKGFKEIGHQALALNSPVSSEELAMICRNYSFDVIIQVNRMRDPKYPLPAHIRHIAWFQDIFPDTLNEIEGKFQESDIVYTLGDPTVLGITMKLPCFVGSLATGVDMSTIFYKNKKKTERIDFSLCGYIPPPLSKRKNLKKDLFWFFFKKFFLFDHIPSPIFEELIHIVELEYIPLQGNLNIYHLSNALREHLCEENQFIPIKIDKNFRFKTLNTFLNGYMEKIFLKRLKGKSYNLFVNKNSINGLINFLSREYPRFMDRRKLINLALSVSNSVELYGPGFDKYFEYKDFYKGSLNLLSDLLDVYQKSRINLANNTHGVGLHSRALECMAVGGFIFLHQSPQDTKPLGILTAFDPGVHFGFFTTENFREESIYWLKNDEKRKWVGQQASEAIQKNHLWSHRAMQVISDLEK